MSRSAVKQKKGRNSELISSTLMHVGMQQKLFLETHMCPIYRITLLKSEQFSESKALSLIEKYHKKRQSHCTSRLLEDRLSLEKTKSTGKTPFRPWVGYREITHLYVGHSKPDFMVLCIDSQKSSQRYYEIYKFKTTDSARKAEELIRRAMNEPDKILRDANSLGHYTVTENERVRSLAQFEMQDNRESVVENGIYIAPPTPEPETVVVPQAKQVLVSSANRVSPDLSYDHNGLNGLSDITYIAIDPKQGARASKRGPIYMFVERFKNSEFRKDRDNYYGISDGSYDSRY